MFDDLIKPKSKSSTSPSGGGSTVSSSTRSRKLTDEEIRMMNLLIDTENLIVDMNYEYTIAIGGCLVCGNKEGEGHKDKCDVRTTILRLSTEIDRIDHVR